MIHTGRMVMLLLVIFVVVLVGLVLTAVTFVGARWVAARELQVD
ncbi:MAG TPA: hypothetical protein VHU17_04525 [Acidimicrobiales bacterium]|nr:hypothetical protein [Acidimicrobiales bacterium]